VRASPRSPPEQAARAARARSGRRRAAGAEALPALGVTRPRAIRRAALSGVKPAMAPRLKSCRRSVARRNTGGRGRRETRAVRRCTTDRGDRNAARLPAHGCSGKAGERARLTIRRRVSKPALKVWANQLGEFRGRPGIGPGKKSTRAPRRWQRRTHYRASGAAITCDPKRLSSAAWSPAYTHPPRLPRASSERWVTLLRARTQSSSREDWVADQPDAVQGRCCSFPFTC
jgi:hypothetical protein